MHSHTPWATPTIRVWSSLRKEEKNGFRFIVFWLVDVRWWRGNKTEQNEAALYPISLEFKIPQGFGSSSKLSQIYLYLLDFCWAFWRCKLNKSIPSRWNLKFTLGSPNNMECGDWKPESQSRETPSGLRLYLIFLIYWGNPKAHFPPGSSLAGVSKPRASVNPIRKEKYGEVIRFKSSFLIFRKDLWETGAFLTFSKSLLTFWEKDAK